MSATTTPTTPTLLNGFDPQALQGLIDKVTADPSQGLTRWNVTTHWQGGAKTRTQVDHYEIGGERIDKDWSIATDEPLEIGGTNTTANPQEVLMAGLNACMMVGYSAVATLMGITLESVEIQTQGDIDLRGFLAIDESVPPGYDKLQYTVRIKSDGTDEQIQQLHAAVQKTSPNYYNITHAIAMDAELVIE